MNAITVQARRLGSAYVDLRDVRIAAFFIFIFGLMIPLLAPGAGLPCPLRTLTGVPCPLCGMTTSVEDTLHGDVHAAISANPAGPLLLVLAIAACIAGFRRTVVTVPYWIITIGLGSTWLWELHRFHWI